MRRHLLDILACPIDKHYPLELHELTSQGDLIVEGALSCSRCGRFYPIIDEIPVMLPDELRDQKEDLHFLSKWVARLPAKIVYEGLPVRLSRET
jgi:uncharacterized protein YbaR (Trm112 family)